MNKPRPYATETSRPFWEGLRRGEVRLQRCRACARWVFYPRSHCPGCLSDALAWQTVSGRGRLHTFTISRVPTVAMFADEVPQRLAVVELEEGVRLTSTLVDVDDAQIEIGMALLPVFEPVEGGEGVLLRYRPATHLEENP
jgi:hypothetical protein